MSVNLSGGGSSNVSLKRWLRRLVGTARIRIEVDALRRTVAELAASAAEAPRRVDAALEEGLRRGRAELEEGLRRGRADGARLVEELERLRTEFAELRAAAAETPGRLDSALALAVERIAGLLDARLPQAAPEAEEPAPAAPAAVPEMPPLGEVHLRNARLLPSREHILDWLPKGGTATEIGVAVGGFSRVILDRLRPDRFVAVDLFDGHTWPHLWGQPAAEIFGALSHEDWYRRQFAAEVASGQMDVRAGDSALVLRGFPDAHFDFIYVDGDHSYAGVRRDLAVANRKIKPGGHIILNDYTMADPIWNAPYGVIRATNEFCLREGWEIIFFALEPRMFCDVALRRLPFG